MNIKQKVSIILVAIIATFSLFGFGETVWAESDWTYKNTFHKTSADTIEIYSNYEDEDHVSQAIDTSLCPNGKLSRIDGNNEKANNIIGAIGESIERDDDGVLAYYCEDPNDDPLTLRIVYRNNGEYKY